jgi:hypothetical protein
MSMSKKILTFAAPAALLALSACATGFRADVSRFQAMPAPAGQTFVIQAADPRNRGGLEFSQYAGLVAQYLEGEGYRQAASAEGATFVVELDYGVDSGRTQVYSTPGSGFGYRPYYSRFGYFGYPRSPFFYGWHDPFWGPYDYPEVRSYTVFTSYLDMDIKRTIDGQPLFEGTAQARSRSDELPRLVPNLVEAMFVGFPGNSGEAVRITVPEPRRGG